MTPETPPRRRWWASLLVFVAALTATAPTTGDFGLTWDEPAYRYSQMVSAQWWAQLAAARSPADLAPLLDADALLYYWPYARHGINFHPPLAGQLSLLTHATLGSFLKDIPARRMGSVLEFCLAITLLNSFLTRRYGPFCGLVAATALLTMPRLYGDAHIFGTDTPGLLLWPAAAFAAWKGLNEPEARGSRVAFGFLVALGFLTKMAAIVVLVPVLGWVVATRIPKLRKLRAADWLDTLLTLGLLAAPLLLAFAEIRRLADLLPDPQRTDLFLDRPASRLPGLILLAPLALWSIRWLLARFRPRSPLWGTDRPALELVASVLAFGPAIGWLGNPAWWREALPRLAHYYTLNTNRSGALPDIRIYYWGETYLYSLPWHNAFVLLAITVPVSLLLAAMLGLARGALGIRLDRLPLYLLLHLLTLPAFRMLNTPAHDGVRLFLPTFYFLAAFAGLGADWLRLLLGRRKPLAANSSGSQAPDRPSWPARLVPLGLLVLFIGPSAFALVRIHPYELSYYNALVGGPAGAWRKGFELSYWYDAYNPAFLADLNRDLPPEAAITPPNAYSDVPTFPELQALGQLRADLRINDPPPDDFPHKWLLTHDSKADGYSRLLFALSPRHTSNPRQLAGLRVASVADPKASAIAWALELLSGSQLGRAPRIEKGHAPSWLPAPLARLWGDGIARPAEPAVNEGLIDWARTDGPGLVAAAEALATADLNAVEDPGARRLLARIEANFPRSSLRYLLRRDATALPAAARLLAERPDEIRAVLLRPGYTPPESIGGYLDSRSTAPAASP